MGRVPDGASYERGSIVYLTRVVLVATLGGLLFGYDTAVISGAIGFLQAHFEFSATTKGWAASCALAGCIAGVVLAGPVSDRFGRRNTLMVAAVLFLVSAIGTAVPRSLTTFVVFRIIGGIGVGAASMTSPMYIAEISPARLRGRMVSINQFAIIFGMLLVYFVNYFIAEPVPSADHVRLLLNEASATRVMADDREFDLTTEKIAATRVADARALQAVRERFPDIEYLAPITGEDEQAQEERKAKGEEDQAIMLVYIKPTWNGQTGWRWMFGSESLPALLLLLLLLTVPESPRWLTGKNRADKARQILERIDGAEHSQREMQEIRAAIAEEPVSMRQLFSPGLRWALWIGVVLAVLQQVTGINVFLYYAPEIFKGIAGENVDAALLQTIVVGAVNLGFTVIAIWTVDKLGRKPLMVTGSAGMGLCLTALGLAACFGHTGAWILTFILGYIACFALAVGPVTWVILSEIFPTRVRGRALAVATFCLWLANLIVSQTFPMMDESAWLIEKFNHGFPFLIYAGFCAVLVWFVIVVVPETKGKTLEQIEKQWSEAPAGEDGRESR